MICFPFVRVSRVGWVGERVHGLLRGVWVCRGQMGNGNRSSASVLYDMDESSFPDLLLMPRLLRPRSFEFAFLV